MDQAHRRTLHADRRNSVAQIDKERHSSKTDKEDPSTWKDRTRQCTQIYSGSCTTAQGHTGDINRDQVLTSSSFNTQ